MVLLVLLIIRFVLAALVFIGSAIGVSALGGSGSLALGSRMVGMGSRLGGHGFASLGMAFIIRITILSALHFVVRRLLGFVLDPDLAVPDADLEVLVPPLTVSAPAFSERSACLPDLVPTILAFVG
jgi:hypothetical protein